MVCITRNKSTKNQKNETARLRMTNLLNCFKQNDYTVKKKIIIISTFIGIHFKRKCYFSFLLQNITFN